MARPKKVKRGRPKKVKVEEIVETPTEVKEVLPTEPTEDELELEALKGIREELDKRGIHDVGTLSLIIERLQTKIQSQKA